MSRFILFLLAFALLISCEKEPFPRKGEGVLQYFAGDCGWLIELDVPEENIRKLEIANHESFESELEDGAHVEFKCRPPKMINPYCMMGYGVDLVKLKKK